MELTDRHYRFLARLFSRKSLLFTEMVTAKAILHGNRDYLLGFNREEHPLVLQLGGADPIELAAAASIGESFGYDEINLNVGCPSDRVKSGRFGACLMAEPDLVGQCVAAMQQSVSVPVTVKCRVGIDRNDAFGPFADFVEIVSGYGCDRFYVHARKAWLDGLSPKENREIPPLRYDFVHRLKREKPQLQIVINGGISSWTGIDELLSPADGVALDGVMLGREAYYNPAFLRQVDGRLFSTRDESADNSAVARSYADYMEDQLQKGVPLTAMSRHIVALFQSVPGAKSWRRHLSSNASRSDSAITLVEDALRLLVDVADGTAIEPDPGQRIVS